MNEVIVQVKEGKLKGKKCVTDKNKEYFLFQSVPYAKPPVGELRFKAPQPPEPWIGIRNATEEVKGASHLDRQTGTLNGSEDCLYLNISTPELPNDQKNHKPVMVYFHGGGFSFGTMAGHGGDFLVEKDVVYVAVQYRLNIFGFLCLDIEEAQGNMGLKDKVQALRWVKENISEFGGDPNNVTLMGISAGGVAVEFLILSPMAKGLFHKAIAHSGSTLNQWAINRQNEFVIENLKKGLKISFRDNRELHKSLMKLSTLELAKLDIYLWSKKPREFSRVEFFPFVPIVEKAIEGCESIITEGTYSLLKSGEFTKVPYLSGVCEREGLLLYNSNEAPINKLLENHNFSEYLPFNLSDTKRAESADKFKEIYLERTKITGFIDSPAVDFIGDIEFIAGVCIASKLISKFNPCTYFYKFCYDGTYNFLKADNNWNFPGAAHVDDTGYILAVPCVPKNGTSTDDLVRERFVQMWVNFAKYGNPTPVKTDLLPVIWESISENNKKYLRIDKELSMEENMETRRISLYEELYDKYWE